MRGSGSSRESPVSKAPEKSSISDGEGLSEARDKGLAPVGDDGEY